jgi:hypothetical protein
VNRRFERHSRYSAKDSTFKNKFIRFYSRDKKHRALPKNKKKLSRVTKIRFKTAPKKFSRTTNSKTSASDNWVELKEFTLKLNKKLNRARSSTNRRLVKKLHKRVAASYFLSKKLKKLTKTPIIAKNLLKFKL